jgi:hypothetical protein
MKPVHAIKIFYWRFQDLTKLFKMSENREGWRRPVSRASNDSCMKCETETITLDREREDLLQWLAPVGPKAAHSKACAVHHHGTSDWFLQGPLKQFLESRPGKGAILWLKGKCSSKTLACLEMTFF